MRFTIRVHSLLLIATLSAAPALADGSSALFGDEGELWQPRGRLPDFSYAGYRAGREAIPHVPVVVEAREFGARANGSGDQTREIQAAIDAAARRGGGAVKLERGKYRLEGKLKLNESKVVLRGEGADDTTLFFVNSLRDLHGFDIQYANGANGLVQAGRDNHDTYRGVADIARKARRGDRSIVLERDARAEGIRVGSVLRVVMEPRDLSLWNHMHNNQNPDPDAAGNGSCDDARGKLGDWVGVVAAIDGKKVTFDQPLRINIEPHWRPKLTLVRAVREVGVENLRIEFERKAHKRHHEEPGYNAIGFDEGTVIDSWIKNVRIHNADNGIALPQSKRVTVSNVRITADRDCSRTAGEGQFGCTTGHHGVKAGIDSLFEDLDIDTNFIHELSFVERTSGSVCSRCGGDVKWSIDHHGRGQHDNLVTQLRANYDYEGGGGACRPAAGARNVQWGFARPLRPPPWIGMQTTLVGDLKNGVGQRRSEERGFIEQVGNPGNLYELQLERRRAIENRDGRFADGAFGTRAAFVESSSQLFGVRTQSSERDVERSYAIMSTVYDMAAGDNLGARAFARTAPLDDAEIVARVRTPEQLGGGRRNRSADYALILAASGDAYYYALYTSARDKSGIFLAQGRRRTRLAAVNGSAVDDGAWHRVSFERRGDRLIMGRDGRVLADVRDARLGRGRVGVGALNDAAFFDDIRVLSGGAPVHASAASDGDGARDAILVDLGALLDPDEDALVLPGESDAEDDAVTFVDGADADAADAVDDFVPREDADDFADESVLDAEPGETMTLARVDHSGARGCSAVRHGMDASSLSLSALAAAALCVSASVSVSVRRRRRRR